MKFIVQSFPRSGANFLVNNLRLSCDKYVGISHHPIKLNPNKTIINIIRNPTDSIASIIWVNEQVMGGTDMGITSQVNLYNIMYQFILDGNGYRMSFDKLTSNPKEEIRKILQYFNIEEIEHLIELTEDKPDMSFHASSKNNERYNEILKAVRDFESKELVLSYKLYTRALALCH